MTHVRNYDATMMCVLFFCFMYIRLLSTCVGVQRSAALRSAVLTQTNDPAVLLSWKVHTLKDLPVLLGDESPGARLWTIIDANVSGFWLSTGCCVSAPSVMAKSGSSGSEPKRGSVQITMCVFIVCWTATFCIPAATASLICRFAHKFRSMLAPAVANWGRWCEG